MPHPFPLYESLFSSRFLMIVDCIMFNPVSTVLQSYHHSQCTYPCFPGFLITSTLLNSPSKPLVAFPRNHCQNNRQRCERNESCRNNYHQSSERILTDPGIEPATPLFSSLARYGLSHGARVRVFKTWYCLVKG